MVLQKVKNDSGQSSILDKKKEKSKKKKDPKEEMGRFVDSGQMVQWDEIPDIKNPAFACELVGEQGTGKTHVGGTFPKPALLDTEGKGWVVWKKLGHKTYFRAHSFDDVINFCHTVLNDPEIETAVFDSSRDLVDMSERFTLQELGRDTLYSTKGAVLYSHVYGKLDWIVQTLRNANKNVVFTSRLKDEYINDKKTGGQIPDGYKKAIYQFDIVIRFTTLVKWDDEMEVVVQPVGKVVKDGFIRRGQYKPYLKDCTYQSIIDNLLEPIDDVDKYMKKFMKEL